MRRTRLLFLTSIAALVGGSALALGPASTPGPRISAAVASSTTIATTTTTTTTTTTVPPPTTTTEPPPPPTTAPAPPPTTAAPAPPPPVRVASSWPASLQPCDGAYPPCWVAWNESRGDYNVVSPDGLYYGKWQFLPSTWDGAARRAGRGDLVGVLPNVASPADQDAIAASLWDGGAGCSHWGACGR